MNRCRSFRHALPGAALSLWCWAIPVTVRAQQPVVVAIQLPPPLELAAAMAVDVDGDGREDLVIACHEPERQRRELRVHLRGAGDPAFALTPSRPPLPVPTDVIAFTVADCLPAAGRELVLLTAERAVAVAAGKDGQPEFTPLGAIRLVWPAPAPDLVLPLGESRFDLAGDGRDGLLLPEPDGVVWLPLQGDRAPYRLELPPWRSPLADASRGAAGLQQQGLGLRLQLASGAGGEIERLERDRLPLARIQHRSPPYRVLDLDGDGRPRLVAVRNEQVFIATLADHGFAVAQRPLPLPEDRLVLFDPAFDVQLVDVDGDRRLDLVLTTSARRDDEVEVRVDLFRTRPDGGWPGKPDGRLRLQTLLQPVQLVDVDGDGRPDLVALTVRTERLRALTGARPTAIEVQLSVFRGTGERFTVPASSSAVLHLPAAVGTGSQFAHVLAARDGSPARLLVREEDQLSWRPLVRDGARLRLAPAAARVPVPESSWLRLASSDGEVLIGAARELLHVRMR